MTGYVPMIKSMKGSELVHHNECFNDEDDSEPRWKPFILIATQVDQLVRKGFRLCRQDASAVQGLCKVASEGYGVETESSRTKATNR